MNTRTVLMLALLLTSNALAQSPSPGRSFFSRILHPFGSSHKPPKYRDPRLRGLLLELEVPGDAVRLSEVRQLHIRARLSNLGGYPVSLDFPTSQRIDIQLLNASGQVLTRWSQNRAFGEEPGSLLVNPHEQVLYEETIATRELQPGT